MFLATKTVEARRFSQKISGPAMTKLKELQKQLDISAKKLTTLKANPAERKKKSLMREAETQVAEAEDAQKTMAQAAKCYEDDSKLSDLSSADIQKAQDDISKADADAAAKIATARKYIHERQIEAKGKDASVDAGA